MLKFFFNKTRCCPSRIKMTTLEQMNLATEGTPLLAYKGNLDDDWVPDGQRVLKGRPKMYPEQKLTLRHHVVLIA